MCEGILELLVHSYIIIINIWNDIKTKIVTGCNAGYEIGYSKLYVFVW